MIAVEEALARILAAVSPLEAETVPLEAAAGRVLAHDATARVDRPPFAVSAMDGYAVRAVDTERPPAALNVIGEAPAGHPFEGRIGGGEAVRIFTGGAIPDGADAVVMQEDAGRDGDTVTIRTATAPGRYIRRAGLDFRAGEILASAGKRLTARDVALLAAGDLSHVEIRRRPRIAIAATGDELSRPGEPRQPGGIAESSLYGLSAQIESWGGEARDLGIFPDRLDALAQIAQLAAGADFLVTIGGVSVGDSDLVRRALEPQGFALDFWKVAMRPGKPLLFGRLGETPLLGPPGNPVSAFVCALIFLKPAIAAMLGLPPEQDMIEARAAVDIPANDGRQDYLRCRLFRRDGRLWAEPFAAQDSSMQKAFAQADALLIRPPDAPPARRGDSVTAILLE